MASLDEKAQEREIEGVTYRVWPVPWRVGKPALVRLLNVVSPVLAALFRTQDKNDMVAAVFQALPSVLSDADLDYFARAFGDAAQYKNARGDWSPLVEKVQSDHFEGRYLAYFKWLAFCCEVNFSSFFGGIKDGAGADGLLRMVTST